MVEHFLLPYLIRARPLHAREWLGLGEIAEEAEAPSFIEWLHAEFTAARARGFLEAGPKRTVSISEVEMVRQPFPLVEGRAETGLAGVVGRGIDTSGGRGRYEEVYRRKPWIAEVQPFYYGICDTPDETTAVAILHSIGKSGIKGAVADFLGGRLRAVNEDWRLHMLPLIPTGSVFEQLSSDEILRLEYRKRQRAGDIGDVPFQANSRKVVTISVELKVHGAGLPLAARSRQRRLEELAARHALFGQEFEEVRADVLIEGKKRTIRLDHPGNVQPRYELGEYFDADVLSEEDLAAEIERVYAAVRTDAHSYLNLHRRQFEGA